MPISVYRILPSGGSTDPSDYITLWAFCQVFFSHREKIFRSVRPADSVGLYHIFGGLSSKKQQQQKKFFCQDESAFIVKFFTEKIFRFFDPTGSGRVCQEFFSEAAKKFLSSIFSKKKKKKIVPPLLYHISWALSSVLIKFFWKTFLLLKAFSSWHKGKNML